MSLHTILHFFPTLLLLLYPIPHFSLSSSSLPISSSPSVPLLHPPLFLLLYSFPLLSPPPPLPLSFPSPPPPLPLSSPLSSDPNAYSMSKVNLSVGHDPALRMQNLQLLVVRIKHFYLTYLQQLVISTLPNVSAICHSPDSGKLASL